MSDAATASAAADSRVREVLAAAVAALGGQERPGQVDMAEAVAAAMESGEHLLVQAGTGTGKSLGYLVPAMLNDDRVVVATATLALQHQLVERDIPALVEAVKDVLHETPSYAVLKGRSNYACLHRIREGVPDDQGALVELPEGSLGAEVLAMREWVEEEAQGRRHRRARPRAAAHRPDLATGLGVAPGVPGGREVPVRRRVLRGACPRARDALAGGGHEPLAAGDRRGRGRADDPGLRHGRDRRGPRAGRPGHPGRDRRAVRLRGGPDRAPGVTSRRRIRGRRPGRRR